MGKLSTYATRLRNRILKYKDWLKINKKDSRTDKYKRTVVKFEKLKKDYLELIFAYLEKNPSIYTELRKHEEKEPGYVYWAREEFSYRKRLVIEARKNIEEGLLIYYKKII